MNETRTYSVICEIFQTILACDKTVSLKTGGNTMKFKACSMRETISTGCTLNAMMKISQKRTLRRFHSQTTQVRKGQEAYHKPK